MSWLVRKNNGEATHAPIDINELRQWIWEGGLGPNDMVSEDGGETWHPVIEVDELKVFLGNGQNPAETPFLDFSPFIKERRRMTAIDLAPLIDVVFLLLIFFLVSTRFAVSSLEHSQIEDAVSPQEEVQLEVDLAEIESESEQTKQEKEVRIYVTGRDEIFLGNRRVSIQALTSSLRTMIEPDARLTAVIIADQNLRYGDIVRVMAAARAGGAEEVSIAASRR